MSKATYPLKLPVSIKRAAERLAKEDGVLLNQWIASAVAQKVGVAADGEGVFRRARKGRIAKHLKAMLQRAPDRAPDERDRL